MLRNATSAEAIGAAAKAHRRHLDTMGEVSQGLRGNPSHLEQATAAMAGRTGNIGPQIKIAVGQSSGQLSGAMGDAVTSAMANAQTPLPPPATAKEAAAVTEAPDPINS